MNANYRKLLTVSVVAGLVALAAEMASAQSWLDASSKMRGNYGQAGASSSVSGGTVYRAPVIARAPAATRSFSYEPSQATGGCGSVPVPAASTATKAPATDTLKKAPDTKKVDTAKKVETAKNAPTTTLTFSYQPSVRSYSAPATRSQTPLYLIPKSLR